MPISPNVYSNLLIERGMEIPDREHARHYLNHLNHYHLGANWLPFEIAGKQSIVITMAYNV